MIQTLHRVLPASDSIIPNLYSLTADSVISALDMQGILFSLNRIGINDWELESSELTDKQIFTLLKIDQAGHQGQVSICTEACTRYGYEPFNCDVSDLEQFVSNYDIEMFFDGDVILLCEESRTLTVYHHAGAYLHVKL